MENINDNLKGDLISMISEVRLSKTIERFLIAEIIGVVKKYMKLTHNTINEVERFVEGIESEEVREVLYRDLDETINVMRLAYDKGFNKDVITMYFWIKSQTNLNISLEQVNYYYNNLKLDGYVVIDEESVIYRRNTCLKNMAREVLENAMQYDTYVAKLLDKEEIIEYWLNGTSVSEVIDDLVNSTDVRELLDLEQLLMFKDGEGEEYMYSYIEI